MRALLDTHTFIWWDGEPSRLSPRVLALLQDPSCEVLLSVVSLWEMLIKSQLGKMTIRLPLAEIVAQQVDNGLTVLPVTISMVTGRTVRPSIMSSTWKDCLPYTRTRSIVS